MTLPTIVNSPVELLQFPFLVGASDSVNSQWPTLEWTTFTLLFGLALVIGTACVSWIALKRTGFSKSMMAVESLRFLLALLVAVGINQPEWLQEFVPTETPTLAVLWDDSDSMSTQDVTDNERPDAPPVSRREWVAPMLSDEIWAPLREKVEVVKIPFSSLLPNPKQGTDIGAALDRVLDAHTNLRGVVMFSDGDWNIGNSPAQAATQLRMKKIPLYSVAVGSDRSLPDVEVAALDAPTFGVANKPTRIPFTITSTMAKPVVAVVSLTTADSDELTKRIEIPANGRLESTFTWKPKKKGEYTLMLTLPTQDGELVTENNSLSVPIVIREESLKVLVVEAFPRWEYRFLRNALSRDPGVDVSCLLFHPGLPKVGGGKGYLDSFPSTTEELSKYDVVFLGDVGVGEGQLTVEDCRLLRGLVESQASGLILMPGFRGNQFSLTATELEALFPVQFDDSQTRGWGSQTEAKFQLTEVGENSLLTKLADNAEANIAVWESLPGFQWYAPVLRAKAGSQVLAVHESESNQSGRIPLLATKTFGAGKVLFMGTDGAWRWRKGVEDKFHYRFWGQVIRWMAYQRNMAGGQSMRLFYSPDRPRAGETLTLNANVMDVSGAPLQDGTVKVQIIPPSGNSTLVRLGARKDETQWGLFSNTFTPQESGDHQILMTCRENGSTLETTIDIQGSKKERRGKPVNLDLLQELAGITRGKMVETNQIAEIFEAIESLPDPKPKQKRIRIWAHPYWCFVMVGLLCVFWIARKRIGKI